MNPDCSLIHTPLAHWASVRGSAWALVDGAQEVSFAQLHERVERCAQALCQSMAPSHVFVDVSGTVVEQVVQFLGINASGRCAVMTDPAWPEHMHAQARAAVAGLNEGGVGKLTDRSPCYLGFTSGSTGQPKGFRRDHRSWVRSFEACRRAFGEALDQPLSAPGRVSHSLFLFGVLQAIWLGAGAVVQEKFSAAATLATLRSGATPALIAVPSQLLMLLEHAQRKGLAPMPGVQLIMISGARWMRQRTPDLQRWFPQAKVVEFYGSSETSFVAWMPADEQAPTEVVGVPFDGVEIDIRPTGPDDGASSAGLIFVRSPMLFMDQIGLADDVTAAWRDGEWLSVRDMGYIDDLGRLCLTGRQNRMIVTQGKNLFPEELETRLAAMPGVMNVAVLGRPDAVRGQVVVAVLRLTAEAAATCTARELAAWCRAQLEAYKVPKRFHLATHWPLTRSGKTDHTAIERALASEEVDWLHRLP